MTELLKPTEPGGVSTLGAFINTAADNLRGQGANIRDTIIELSQTLSALGDHSNDIFTTFKNLSTLVSALHDSADLLEQLNRNMASVTSLMADDPREGRPGGRGPERRHRRRPELRGDNREAVGTATDKLTSISDVLVGSLDDLKQTLHIAPTRWRTSTTSSSRPTVR